MSTETVRLIRDGERGGGEEGVRRWRMREIIYLSLHCHHQNDSCIEMGGTKSEDSVHRPQRLKRMESRSRFKPRSPCLPA